jgi:GMP synthase (glutamine-hydrolysing)
VKIFVLRAGDVAATVRDSRGEFDVLIRETVGDAWRGSWETVDVRTDVPLPSPEEGAAFIVTGSSSSVTERAPWMLRAEAHLRELVAAGAPVLGICFGHQLLAQALGGEVAKNPRGREIGTVQIARHAPAHADDPLFHGLPSTFQVNATHVDTVVKLPPGARVLAVTDREPTAAFGLGDHVRAVQFHPEIDADAMRGYVKARWDVIAKDGLDPQAIWEAIGNPNENGQVLRNFVLHFVRR